MKLEKAKRRLQGFVRWRKPDPKDNFVESVQIGIEAIDLVQKMRKRLVAGFVPLLPSETED